MSEETTNTQEIVEKQETTKNQEHQESQLPVTQEQPAVPTKPADTISLTLLDRIVLPSILKQEFNYKTFIINKDINDKIRLTQDELIKFDFKTVGKMTTWNNEADKLTFDYYFTTPEKNEIKERLMLLDSQEKMTSEHVGLYEKFTG